MGRQLSRGIGYVLGSLIYGLGLICPPFMRYLERKFEKESHAN